MNNVAFGLAIVLMIAVAVGFSAIVMANSPGFPSASPVVSAGAASPNGAVLAADGVQDVYIKALGTGAYDHPQVAVKKGVPVRLHFSTDGRAGCGNVLYLDGFGVRLASSGEEQIATFTPTDAGTYAYHCGMNMFRGQMVVS